LTRTSQIMIGALVAGVLMAVVAAVIVDLATRPQVGAQQGAAAAGAGVFGARGAGGTLPIITYCALAFAVVLLPLSFLVPVLVTDRSRQQMAQGKAPPSLGGGAAGSRTGAGLPATETGMLAALYPANHLIGAALTEGAAFFAAVAYLVERNPLALGVALLLVVVLIARFPTIERVERWIDQQREKLSDDRNRAGSPH
jgi:hypothetical protein